MSQPGPSQRLPPKKSFLKKRMLEESSDEDVPIVEVFTKDTPKPKRIPFSESKIRGIAEPRKPRIGSAYQAVLPALRATAKPLEGQQKSEQHQ